MTPQARTTLLIAVAAAAVFTVGALTGYAVGRSGSSGQVAAPSSPTPSPSAAVATLPPAVATPSLGQVPAIGTEGRVLAEGTRAVVAAAPGAQCVALVTPGVLGECGEVPVAGNRVVWVIESTPTTTATRAFTVRVFTFVPDESGWVEWLRAEDASGTRWTEVNIVPRDLTGDGVPELVAGFHGQGETEPLSVDAVSYSEVGIPVVVAHMPDADQGSLVFATGGFDLFAARYPANEPACCPPVFSRQSVAYLDGFFRITATQDVLPNAVPPSQV
ncbi:MAG TPA: hypothetical protein VFT27_04170 [Actinomycetota bacterium]|nr:hypothetical protein [Actinomycetota bacterium]